MSTKTYPSSVLLALLAVVLAGCGSGRGDADAGHSGASSAPAVVSSGDTAATTSAATTSAATTSAAATSADPSLKCRLPDGAETATVQVHDEPQFYSVLPPTDGSAGDDVVVLSNQSDRDLCSWMDFADDLRAAGFATVVYNYGGDPADEAEAIAGTLRQHGAANVALLGASEGAKVSIVAGAELRPQPDAVVSLSAEATLRGFAVADSAATLSAPTLLVTAAEDAYGSTAATKSFHRVSPAAVKPLVVIPGGAHGQQLLDAAMTRRILAFLNANARSTGDEHPAGVADTAQTVPPPTGCPSPLNTDDRYLAGPAGSHIQIEQQGTGSTVAVFLHEKGRTGMCGFANYAAWLAQHAHVRSVLMAFCGYDDTDCPTEGPATAPWKLTATVVGWLRDNGARRVVLVGASAGGGDALMAGAGIRPAVAAVVDLSGDDGDGGTLASAARQQVAPVLYAVAPHDPYVTVASQRALASQTPTDGTTLTVVTDEPGSHGWELLGDGAGGWSPLAHTVARWVTGTMP